MKISKTGIGLIKKWEGLKDGDKSLPLIQPYKDPVGIWTVGYGHAIRHPHENRFLRGDKDKELAYRLFKNGITEEEAENLLIQDLERFEKGVTNSLKIKTNQNQFDAFVSLSFNIGIGGFRKSSALRWHNQGLFHKVPAGIKMWNRAGSRILLGLINRREDEAQLYSRA